MKPVFRLLSLLLPIITLCLQQGYAQDNSHMLEEVLIFQKFGDVNMSDLPEGNSEYPYEILLKESSISFEQRSTGIIAYIDQLVRIRVNTNDPIMIAEASLVGIPYYFAEDMERVRNLEGFTHQPNGSRSYFRGSDAVSVDLNSRYRIIEFEMPDVQQGSVIEYKYTLERRYIEELPEFHFSHRVPVNKAVLYLKNKNFMRFDAVPENIDFDLSFREVRVDTSSIPMIFTYERPEPILIQVWEASDVPAIDESAYISSIDDIRGKIRFQISEFGIPRQPLENSWDVVAAQIQRNVSPYRVLDANPGMLRYGAELFSELGDSEARIDSIFAYVNSRVQFNGLHTVFSEGPFGHVLEGEPATQSEINMVLLGLLRGAGFDAKPLFISGRDFGRINKAFPSLYQFNRMLVVTGSGSENRRFMDASFEYSLPDLIPVESYNEQGMILAEREYEWVEISPERSVFALNMDLDASLDREGNLSGTIRSEVRGYPAREMRRDIGRGILPEEIIFDTFFEVYEDARLTNSRITVSETDPDIVYAESSFTIPMYAVTFSEGLEFRPMIVGYLFRNPFEQSKRRVPITLDAPEHLSINYVIRLPRGMRLDVTGETRSTSLQGAELFEEYITEGDRIEYSFDINISRKEFPADDYSQLRRIYERWVALSNNTWYIEYGSR
jgi:hypothetical protein